VSEVEQEREEIDPGLVGRCGWERDETDRDVAVMAWVGRFRFVTAEAVAERFGVSVQAARGRVRRLERVGLVGRERPARFTAVGGVRHGARP
jgi:predicted ArsR family transcriptional regulator